MPSNLPRLRERLQLLRVPLVNQIMITVTDTGPGLKEEEIPLLFKKYQHADKGSGKGGTCLGLHIAKSFVDAHGGRITAHNTATGGSCFSVFLPVFAEGTTAGTERSDDSGERVGT
jgi:signal transduction histidine kinase